MALNYTNMRALAERLIEENGRTVSLVRVDQVNDTDPARPWRGTTGASEISISVLAVMVPFEKEDFEGSLVKRGDMRAFVAATSVEDENPANVQIEDYDYMLDGGVRWKIVEAQSINPGSLRIVYELQLRK